MPPNIWQNIQYAWHNHPLDIWALGSLLLPLLAGLFRVKAIHRHYRLLGWYLLATLIFEMWNNALSFQGLPNHYIYNVFGIIEGVLLGVFYRQLYKSDIWKRRTVGLLGLFLAFSLYDAIWGEANFFHTNTYIASALMLIILVMCYFWQLLQRMDSPNLMTSPTYLISAGVLVYFSGSFFVFLFAGFFLHQRIEDGLFDPWTITSFCLIIYRIFLAVGLWFIPTDER